MKIFSLKCFDFSDSIFGSDFLNFLKADPSIFKSAKNGFIDVTNSSQLYELQELRDANEIDLILNGEIEVFAIWSKSIELRCGNRLKSFFEKSPFEKLMKTYVEQQNRSQ